MIQWKDDYKIGIDKINEQHKKLFEIANRAYDILDFVVNWISEHILGADMLIGK